MRTIPILLAAALLAACDGGVDPSDLARVDEIVLSPADTMVEHPDSFRYRVLLLDASGEPIDDGIDRPMEFDASNQAAVNVTSGGFVRTEAEGATQISVMVGGTTAHASLIVTDTLANPPAEPDTISVPPTAN